MQLQNLRFFALTGLLIASVVKADVEIKHVDLVCDTQANLALVRFSVSWNDAPVMYSRLPKKFDHGLSASDGTDRTECTLANGTSIRVRGGQDQAFGYGQGGGNPPAFFSLWINQRKVFSRKEWQPGYENSFENLPIYDGVVIETDRVTICATAEDKPQQCSGQPLKLATFPIDRVEYPTSENKSPVGSVSLIAHGKANQKFCNTYLDLIKPNIESSLKGDVALNIDWSSLSTQTYTDEIIAYSSLVELLPGTTRRLMIWNSSDHYFDGTVIALAPANMEMQDIATTYRFADIEKWPKREAPRGVTLISGGQKQLYPDVSPRYVHLVPQRIDGALYILAYPTNEKEYPTAALVKPLADGGFSTICAFNRAELNY